MQSSLFVENLQRLIVMFTNSDILFTGVCRAINRRIGSIRGFAPSINISVADCTATYF